MIVVYSPQYRIDIGTHVFPTRKYELLHDRLLATPQDAVVVEPRPAAWDDLALVHTAAYLDKLRSGDFDVPALAQLEVPWSPEVVEGFRLMTGGTIEAARLALERGGAASVFHIGGGFHHAFAAHGEGFCLFNDVAVAIRRCQADGSLDRAAIIDLDVHQGNGTAAIFQGDARVFTCSMHQEHNYPALKPPSSLDIGLPNGMTDGPYLDRLAAMLPDALAQQPGLVFYLAGADPYEDDQLGGLALSKSGLRQRDRLVLDACWAARVPVVTLLAGGYARRLEDTVDIHQATFEEAARLA